MIDEIRTQDPPLTLGQEFVRFEIRSLIGQGDHAFVYDAYDPLLQRTVAIKIIPDPPNSKRDLVQRSIEQSVILRDLNHPNLVSVFDVGTIGDDLVYVVMERLEGQTLRELLTKRELLTALEVTNIGIQVAEGLALAHSQLVIHRDVKPENIFILNNGEIKVINTGITSFIVPSGMVTERDRLRGTLAYMSPEHIQGFGVTESCDIYSLGSVLYECLAGSAPVLIGTENLTLDDVAWRQVTHMPPKLDALLPDMPKYLAHTIQQMLAKEVVLRFESMDVVAARLREAQRQIQEQGPTNPNPSELASITVEQISKRAAVLDAGVNARCPPIESIETHPVPIKHGVRPLVVAILLGALAGVVIAYFKGGSSNEPPDGTQVSAESAVSVGVAASPPGLVDSALAQPAEGPNAAPERSSEANNINNTNSYSTEPPALAPRLSTTPRVVIKPTSKPKASEGKGSARSSGLVF